MRESPTTPLLPTIAFLYASRWHSSKASGKFFLRQIDLGALPPCIHHTCNHVGNELSSHGEPLPHLLAVLFLWVYGSASSQPCSHRICNHACIRLKFHGGDRQVAASIAVPPSRPAHGVRSRQCGHGTPVARKRASACIAGTGTRARCNTSHCADDRADRLSPRPPKPPLSASSTTL